MTLTELNLKKEALSRMLQQLEDIETSCYLCDHFKSGRCLKFDATPPDDFLKAGCEDWEWNGIPF